MSRLLKSVRKALAVVGLVKPPQEQGPQDRERRRPPGRIATGYVRGVSGSESAAILAALEALVDAAEEIISRLPPSDDGET